MRPPRATCGRSACCSGRRSPASTRSGACRCPQVAAAIEAGAAPIGTDRGRIFRRRSRTPSRRRSRSSRRRRPSAERLAADSASGARLAATRSDAAGRGHGRSTAPKPAVASRSRSSGSSCPAALAAVTVASRASLLPFWPPGLVAAARARGRRRDAARAARSASRSRSSCRCSRSATWRRRPRSRTRRSRSPGSRCAGATRARGSCSSPGPLLAAVGALALLPARGPARRAGALRRALQAFAGVLAAAAVAGLRGAPAAADGARSCRSRRRRLDRRRRTSCRRSSSSCRPTPALVVVAVVLALAAALLPDARRRGLRGIAALGVGQIALVLARSPRRCRRSRSCSAPALLCAALAALSLQGGRYP